MDLYIVLRSFLLIWGVTNGNTMGILHAPLRLCQLSLQPVFHRPHHVVPAAVVVVAAAGGNRGDGYVSTSAHPVRLISEG